jgi:hypothetical protein
MLLAAVLAALMVAMILGAAIAGFVLLESRRTNRAEDRQQAFWIAESAVQRAVHRVARSPEYRGEKWTLPAGGLGAGRAGEATIRIEPLSDSRPGLVVRVEASYPAGTVHRSLFRREVVIVSERKDTTPAGKANEKTSDARGVRPIHEHQLSGD